MDKFEVNILGCGSATPSLRHLPSCQVIDIKNTLYMIDCGECAQLSARRMGVKFSRLRHIFISHLHGDHCLGLPGLLSTLSLHHIDGTITVHTFAEGVAMFKQIVGFFCRERTFDLEFNEIAPERGVILDTPTLTVETVPLSHRVPTVGFVMRQKPKARHLRSDMMEFHHVPIAQRNAIKWGADFVTESGVVIPNSHLTTDADPSLSYAYCSDTAYDPHVAECVGAVDLMYHEATYTDDQREKAHQRYHSTAREAGEIARQAGSGALMIGHYSKSYTDSKQHLAEAKAAFGGNVIASTEGLRVPIQSLRLK